MWATSVTVIGRTKSTKARCAIAREASHDFAESRVIRTPRNVILRRAHCLDSTPLKSAVLPSAHTSVVTRAERQTSYVKSTPMPSPPITRQRTHQCKQQEHAGGGSPYDSYYLWLLPKAHPPRRTHQHLPTARRGTPGPYPYRRPRTLLQRHLPPQQPRVSARRDQAYPMTPTLDITVSFEEQTPLNRPATRRTRPANERARNAEPGFPIRNRALVPVTFSAFRRTARKNIQQTLPSRREKAAR